MVVRSPKCSRVREGSLIRHRQAIIDFIVTRAVSAKAELIV